MDKIPTGSELIRPFLPARDRALSARFYDALGFAKLVDGEDVTIFAAGAGGFLLTDFHHQELEGRLMMQLMVDNLDAWWARIESLDLPGTFGVAAPRAPAVQPWGLRVAFLVDPSGILWHVAQRRDGVPQD